MISTHVILNDNLFEKTLPIYYSLIDYVFNTTKNINSFDDYLYKLTTAFVTTNWAEDSSYYRFTCVNKRNFLVDRTIQCEIEFYSDPIFRSNILIMIDYLIIKFCLNDEDCLKVKPLYDLRMEYNPTCITI